MEWCHFWYIVEEESSMRIVQLSGPQGRRLGMVEDDHSIRLLRTHASVVHLAESALAAGSTLPARWSRFSKQQCSITPQSTEGLRSGGSCRRLTTRRNRPDA